jgi:hypothetical protein
METMVTLVLAVLGQSEEYSPLYRLIAPSLRECSIFGTVFEYKTLELALDNERLFTGLSIVNVPLELGNSVRAMSIALECDKIDDTN